MATTCSAAAAVRGPAISVTCTPSGAAGHESGSYSSFSRTHTERSAGAVEAPSVPVASAYRRTAASVHCRTCDASSASWRFASSSAAVNSANRAICCSRHAPLRAV